MVGEDGEEPQRLLPVLGIVLGRQVLQPVEVDALDLHLVEQAGELGRQPRRLVGLRPGLGIAHRQDGAGQQQLAPQRRQRRRQLEGSAAARRLRHGERQLVGIEIAERQQSRQQQRPALAATQQRLLEGPQAAAGRQQHGVAGERERIARGPRQQLRRQGIDEGDAGRNGVEGGRGFRGAGHGP